MQSKMPQPNEANNYLVSHVDLLLSSYKQLIGKSLLPEQADPEFAAKRLFYAPFAVVSHDTSPDPVFNYANLKALTLFEFSWCEFTSLPSRLSAEPVNQPERAALLRRVAELGYCLNYQGIRISKSGRRFYLNNAAIWNLHDLNGEYAGQAASFAAWQFLGES